jgi:uncharacterized protein (TIGR04255 family)
MSHLAPYENWNAVRDEARRLWALYRSIAKPSKLIRLAVRYINRIDMPLPLGDFKDYLRTVPDVTTREPCSTGRDFSHGEADRSEHFHEGGIDVLGVQVVLPASLPVQPRHEIGLHRLLSWSKPRREPVELHND